MDIFTLVGKLILDGKENFTSGLQEIGEKARETAKANEESTKNIEAGWKKLTEPLKYVGAAFTAVGAAGLAIISSSKGMNAQLEATGVVLNKTGAEMRGLVLSITDVGFSVKEVANTIDLLARAGVRNEAVIKANAVAFDALGHVAGLDADTVTGMLLPAYKELGIALPTTADGFDSLTWLVKNTTVGLEDFSGAMAWVAKEGKSLNISMDDIVAMLAILESRGITGTVAIRTFRSAVTEAATKNVSLNSILKITQDEMAGIKTKLDGATGSTQKYADIAETQYTIMDRLKQKWSEISLVLGSWLSTAEPVFAMMTAMGPVLMFLSTSFGRQAVALIAGTVSMVAHGIATTATTIATKAATVAQWLWNAALAANPIGAVIVAVIALGAAVYGIVKGIQGLGHETTALESKFNDLNVKLFSAKAQLDQINLAYQEAQASSYGYKIQLSDLNLKLNDSKDALAAAQEKLKSIQAEFDAATQVVNDFENQIAAAQSELQMLSNPNLEGMGAYKQKIFEVTQAIHVLELAQLEQGETASRTQQIKDLQKELEVLRLQAQVKYDPLINSAQLAAEAASGLNAEMSPEEVMNRIQELGTAIGPTGALGMGLTSALTTQGLSNDSLTTQQGIVDVLTTRVGGYQNAIDQVNRAIEKEENKWLHLIELQTQAITDLLNAIHKLNGEPLEPLSPAQITHNQEILDSLFTFTTPPPFVYPEIPAEYQHATGNFPITEPSYLTRIGSAIPYASVAETDTEWLLNRNQVQGQSGGAFNMGELAAMIASAIRNSPSPVIHVHVGNKDLVPFVYREGYNMKKALI